ncbi:MAG: hypothetical protein F4156_09845 [Holophagales bacterium]|nr:hypothetical protein [Holophagales bacterium]
MAESTEARMPHGALLQAVSRLGAVGVLGFLLWTMLQGIPSQQVLLERLAALEQQIAADGERQTERADRFESTQNAQLQLLRMICVNTANGSTQAMAACQGLRVE